MKGIIDLDNVVSDWAGWVFSQQKEIPKTAGLRSGRLQDMWPGLTDKDVDCLVCDVRGYSDARPVPGALDVLWRLVEDPEIKLLYLSAAPINTIRVRRTWLRKHGFPYTQKHGIIDLIHTGSSTVKVNWIVNHGCGFDFIIDDSLSHLDAALISNVSLRIAFDRPWNAGDKKHDRAYSWYQILSKIRVLK